VLARRGFLLLGLVAGLGLGYLYYTRQVPIYQSGARLLILQSQNSLGNQYIGPTPVTRLPGMAVKPHPMIQSPLVVSR
jgi:uncharacterized protein involved in exopolysaccharide biosynthesis